MSEKSKRKRLLLPVIVVTVIALVLIVGLLPRLKDPSDITIELTGKDGQAFLGTFTVDGQPEQKAGTLPETLAFKTNSISFVVVPAKLKDEQTQITGRLFENEEERGFASSPHGVRGHFLRDSGFYWRSLTASYGGVTAEERNAELTKHD